MSHFNSSTKNSRSKRDWKTIIRLDSKRRGVSPLLQRLKNFRPWKIFYLHRLSVARKRSGYFKESIETIFRRVSRDGKIRIPPYVPKDPREYLTNLAGKYGIEVVRLAPTAFPRPAIPAATCGVAHAYARPSAAVAVHGVARAHARPSAAVAVRGVARAHARPAAAIAAHGVGLPHARPEAHRVAPHAHPDAAPRPAAPAAHRPAVPAAPRPVAPPAPRPAAPSPPASPHQYPIMMIPWQHRNFDHWTTNDH